MQSSHRGGREFLLNQLPNIETPLRDTIFRHIFERNDRVFTSPINITAVYRGSAKQLNMNYLDWTKHAIELLDQLAQDICLALKITLWNRYILGDIITLIKFLMHCFGAWEDLEAACRKRSDTRVQGRDRSPKYDGLANNLMGSLENVNDAFEKLMVHLKSKNCNAKDYIDDLMSILDVSWEGKIPTATLRELFILNEAHGKKEEIWRHVDRILQLPEKAAGGDEKIPIQTEDLTDIICMLSRLCFSIND